MLEVTGLRRVRGKYFAGIQGYAALYQPRICRSRQTLSENELLGLIQQNIPVHVHGLKSTRGQNKSGL